MHGRGVWRTLGRCVLALVHWWLSLVGVFTSRFFLPLGVLSWVVFVSIAAAEAVGPA